MSVCCECCVLLGKGLCVGLINRPDESYRLRCVVVWDLKTSRMRRSWPTGGLRRQIKMYLTGTCHREFDNLKSTNSKL